MYILYYLIIKNKGENKMTNIQTCGVFDWKEDSKAMTFWRKWHKKGFKIYDYSGGGSTWVLLPAKRKPTKKELYKWNLDEEWKKTTLIKNIEVLNSGRERL